MLLLLLGPSPFNWSISSVDQRRKDLATMEATMEAKMGKHHKEMEKLQKRRSK